MKCSGTVDPQFNWDNGKCTPIPPNTSTSTPGPTNSNIKPPNLDTEPTEFDYEVILNKKKLQVFVTFAIAPLSFDLKNSVVFSFKIFQKGVKIQEEISKEKPKHIFPSLTKISETQYRIDLDIHLIDYNVEIKMKFQNLSFMNEDSTHGLYKEKIYKFMVYRVSSYFGLEDEQEKSIREVNSLISDYGIGLNSILPGFAALVAPLNKLRLLALSPTIFEFDFLKFLKFFIKFREVDFFIKLKNSHLFPREQENFRPKNSIFTFQSVYPKIKLTYIVLRVISTFIFCLYFGIIKCGTCKTSNINSPKQLLSYRMKHDKIRQKLINMLIRMMLSLDNINIVANSLYIFTSVFKKLSSLEFGLICFDLFLISIFQFRLYKIFLKYKGMEAAKIKNQ